MDSNEKPHGSVEIRNITVKDSGLYVCSLRVNDHNSTIPELQRTVAVNVRGTVPHDESTEPQIVTPLFEEARYEISTTDQLSTREFDYVWFVPRGMKFQQYFTKNGTRITSSYGPLFDGNTNLFKATLAVNEGIKGDGTYTFVMEYTAANKSQFSLRRQLVVASKLAPHLIHEPTDQGYRVYAIWGNFYTLNLNITQSTNFTILSQSTENCRFVEVQSQQDLKECGIISFVEQSTSESLSEITIHMKIVKSCAFRSFTPAVENDLTVVQFVEISAIDETFSSSLPMDKRDATSFIRSVPDGKRETAEKYLNESIVLRCLVPSCGWNAVGWCKGEDSHEECAWIRRKNGNFTLEGSVAGDRNITVTWIDIRSLTFAAEMRIEMLASKHAGEYVCRISEPVDAKTRSTSKFSSFQLNVLEPVAPKFNVSIVGTQSITIGPSGEAELSCAVYGSPKPSIVWRLLSGSPNSTDDADKVKDTLVLSGTANQTTIRVKQPGEYKCFAENRFDNATRRFKVDPSPVPMSTVPIVLSVVAAAVMITLIMGLLVWMRRRAYKAQLKELARMLRDSTNETELDEILPLNEQTEVLPYNTNYEIDRVQFRLTKIIGDGEFGRVYRGELETSEGGRRYVAVKIPKDPLNPQHYQALISELKIMIYLRPHPNVLSLIGACTSGLERQELFVLTEYCENGSLLRYLQDHTLDFEAQASEGYDTQALLEFAYQAANGMKHLAAQRVIHRDLAVRNLLLIHRRVIKIADFGLSRQKESTYTYNKFLARNVRLPIAWMAPESITRYEYTHKSDVWSFGIVLWEIFTCGQLPYACVDVNGMEIIHWLREGNRLLKPALASEEMHALMLECWSSTPTARPTFSECKRRIATHLETSFPSNYASLGRVLDTFCRMSNNAQEQSHTVGEGGPDDEDAHRNAEGEDVPSAVIPSESVHCATNEGFEADEDVAEQSHIGYAFNFEEESTGDNEGQVEDVRDDTPLLNH